MHRFYMPPEHCRTEPFALTPEDAHHASVVLRLRVGDECTVLNGVGSRWHCRILSIRQREVIVQPGALEFIPAPPCLVFLVPGIAKPKAMDWILQKSVELGAAEVHPLCTDHSVSRPHPDEAREKQLRWQATAIEAAKQCGTAWLTRVQPPQTVSTFLQGRPVSELVLLGSLRPESRPIDSALDLFQRDHQRLPKTISILIGPEGDFSGDELAQFEAKGAVPVTLGPWVLRCETAALAALAIVQHELRRR